MDSKCIPLEDIYRKSFFSARKKLIWRAGIVCDAIVKTFDLKKGSTLIDIGCAIGEYVMEFKRRGICAWGIEGSSNAKDYFLSDTILLGDLRFPLATGYGKWDLCISLEVAEHIEPKFATAYVDNLISLSDTILVTAAPPGQGGHYHVNCRPKEYWIEKFELRGYKRNREIESVYRKELRPFIVRKEIASYYNNAMIFEKNQEG